MKPKLFRVILLVSDIDRAAAFYRAVFGDSGSRVSTGRHYFTDADGTILACLDPRADGDSHDATPNVEWIYLAVDDIEATHEACIKAGATPAPGEVHGAPAGRIAVRPWGERSVYVEDPFGNKVCFVDRTTMFRGGAAESP
jgi:predicted enzyme related to lactoylglutathione lyase